MCMPYRKLRIVWSVAWGVVAVLLGVLCVRSSTLYDHASLYFYGSGVSSSSWSYRLHFMLNSTSDPAIKNRLVYFRASSEPIPKFVWNEPWLLTWRSAVMPLWFSVALCLAVAASSWLPWRFSLRTLLITTTIVAVALGIAIWLWG